MRFTPTLTSRDGISQVTINLFMLLALLVACRDTGIVLLYIWIIDMNKAETFWWCRDCQIVRVSIYSNARYTSAVTLRVFATCCLQLRFDFYRFWIINLEDVSAAMKYSVFIIFYSCPYEYLTVIATSAVQQFLYTW